ncbi:MAG: hypothetical protein QOH93_422 [Chloroflexia bacterium]|jgi:hypothetical protein|nr:hypothetical protein [Chloroflexia bacterium]
MNARKYPPHFRRLAVIASLVTVILTLSGCLEQLQSTRIPSGSVNNFFLHLYAGELDDARVYYAPGLVTPSAELDQSLKDASNRLRHYEIDRDKPTTEDLSDGQVRVTLKGRVRPRPEPGEPTPSPGEGWQTTDILTARLVERGPGWRILDYELKCCP